MKHISSDTALKEYITSLGHKDIILIPNQANACLGVSIDPATHIPRLIYSLTIILDNYHYEQGLSYSEASKRFANDIFAPIVKHANRAPLICYELLPPHPTIQSERATGRAIEKEYQDKRRNKPSKNKKP